jgi:hypothetical protein
VTYNQRVYEEAADLLAVCASTPGVTVTEARPALGASSAAAHVAATTLLISVLQMGASEYVPAEAYADAEACLRATLTIGGAT